MNLGAKITPPLPASSAHGRVLPERAREAGFAHEWDAFPLEDTLLAAARATPADGQRALLESPLSLEGAAVLLKLPFAPLLDALQVRAQALTEATFHRTLLLFAPCYLSSFCVNSCRYCSFSFEKSAPRRWISSARAAEEVASLAAHGLQRVVFVAGEYPSVVTESYVAQALTFSRSVAPELELNVGPAKESAYRHWRRSGATGVVCFQETYDPLAYAEAHPHGPKNRFEFRLATLERAARAGMKRLGLGILLGLSDPARDLLCLIAHARFLRRNYPQVEITVSLPRICQAEAGFVPAADVQDEELLRAVAVLRLALPEAGLVLSAREPDWLRSRFLSCGISHLSTDGVAEAGAYVECLHQGGAAVRDRRSTEELRWDIEDAGYRVRWSATCV